MIFIKSPQEIEVMTEGGVKLKRVLDQLLAEVKVGVTPLDIDGLADELIAKEGGKPSFKMVADYRWATCICVNDCVVHGIPTDQPFAADDVVGVDVGMFYKGFHTDTSWTKEVRSTGTKEFLRIGEEALERAINQMKIGNHVGHISQAIEDIVEGAGFSVVHELVGHGVGKKLHEDPEVPGFLGKKVERTPRLVEGMVLAIEVIYNMGKKDVYIDDADGWTIRTKDGTLSGLFEKTVALTSKGARVLT